MLLEPIPKGWVLHKDEALCQAWESRVGYQQAQDYGKSFILCVFTSWLKGPAETLPVTEGRW